MSRPGRGGGRGGGRRDGPPGAPAGEPLVVLLEAHGRFLTGEPVFGPGRRVTVERGRDARPGHLALLRPARGGVGRARVERLLGRPDVARDVLEAYLLHRGMRRRFPAGVERAAREAVERTDGMASAEGAPRRDLRSLPTLTIDPVTAQDFDDAISAERLGERHWRVWVHIADVSAFVRPGSPVDREAHRRSTSVYVPGTAEPMLPEALSSDACSLRPRVDRLAVTVELELRGPEVVKAAFHRSLIRSDVRLDYDEVDRLFAGAREAQAPWAEPLAAAREAAAALQAKRDAQGALAVESAEPEFAFDRGGHVTGQEASVQTESHRLVEHLMIAANEQVATLLADRGVPALYRVHERPDPPAVERLVEALASLGVPTPPVPEHLSGREAAELVAQASHLIDQHVRRTGHGRAALTSLLLRSLKQARYDPQPLGHAGLGLRATATSPRPSAATRTSSATARCSVAVGGGEEPPPAGTLEEEGAWTSARERDAMSIERGADDIARCFLLERELYEEGFEREFDGEVSGLIGAGAFVAFGEGHEGMLPVRRLRGDWWELNEQGTILVGTETGRTLRLGDPVRVRVRHVDRLRGRVDLDLA